MSWMRFLHRKRSDAELEDEIEAFLSEETADNVARPSRLLRVGIDRQGKECHQHGCSH